MYIRHPEVLSSFCIRHYLIPTYANLNPHLRRGDVTAPFTSLFARINPKRIAIIISKKCTSPYQTNRINWTTSHPGINPINHTCIHSQYSNQPNSVVDSLTITIISYSILASPYSCFAPKSNTIHRYHTSNKFQKNRRYWSHQNKDTMRQWYNWPHAHLGPCP